MMILQKPKISQAYAEHIQDVLRQQTVLNPFFVTTVLRDAGHSRSLSLPRQVTYAMQQYDRVYRHLTSRLINNFSKKPHLQPLAFDFLDLPHTRDATLINLYAPSTPHIHSIYLVHEATLERFRALQIEHFHSIASHPALESVLSIHAAPIEEGTLPRVVSYAAKLLENPLAVTLAEDTPLFTQHPIATFERDLGRHRLEASGRVALRANQKAWKPSTAILTDFDEKPDAQPRLKPSRQHAEFTSSDRYQLQPSTSLAQKRAARKCRI